MVTPEDLRKSRDSYAVILMAIIKEVENLPDAIFLLMEGKDSAYYRPRVSAILAAYSFTTVYRNCRGKENLKRLRKAVAENASVQFSRILFFFDRDYEHDIHEVIHQNCYVTDGYSVENYYTSHGAVQACVAASFFSDLLEGDGDLKEVNQVASTYADLQAAFHEATELFNAWAWIQRHTPRQGSLDLDKFEVSSRIKLDVDAGTATALYTLDDLNDLCPQRNPVRQTELEAAYEWFRGRQRKQAFRGKQERDFLFVYLKRLSEAGAKGDFPFTKVRKLRRQISKRDLIADLSPFADTPASLNQFLTGFVDRWKNAGS